MERRLGVRAATPSAPSAAGPVAVVARRMVWSLRMLASHSRLAGAGSWLIFLADVATLASFGVSVCMCIGTSSQHDRGGASLCMLAVGGRRSGTGRGNGVRALALDYEFYALGGWRLGGVVGGGRLPRRARERNIWREAEAAPRPLN